MTDGVDGARPSLAEPWVAGDARIEPDVELGPGTVIWWLSQVRTGAVIGSEVSLGRNVFVDEGVRIGDRVRVQNNALIYAPAVLEDDVFIGPAAVLANDPLPRAVNPDGTPKAAGDWEPLGVVVERGASVGANVTVLGGVRVGRWALAGAGAVVHRDVPDHALVVGCPARRIGWVGRQGTPLVAEGEVWLCPVTGERYADNGRGGLAQVHDLADDRG